MKLHLEILEKIIELPSKDLQETRQLLDDLGLEVKGIEGEGSRTVFTIETLANRGDHIYALGIAREISARLLTPIKHPTLASSLGERRASVPLHIATDKCLRYGLLEMQLPRDMKLRSDVASVLGNPDSSRHPIVHLLNYVLLELGQPMHAFDKAKIEGEIVVSTLEKGEEIRALDGKNYKVPPGSIVIRDAKKIVAVAGVIGCENSMVTPSTTGVLIESALFDPVSVRKTARAMGISTDASYAFERGCDIEAITTGLKRVVYLTAGGAGEGAHAAGFTLIEGRATEKRKIGLSLEKIRTQMNLPRLPEPEVLARLKNLGYVLETHPQEKPSEKDRAYSVTVPSWRLFEVHNEEDLVEDFARSHGLNKVKLELPPLDPEVPEANGLEELIKKIEPALHGSGFFEVITKSLYSAEEVGILSSRDASLHDKHVTIKNALEKNNSHLKVTNCISLARLAESNHRQGVLSCKMYELGRLFSLQQGENSKYQYERDVLSLGVSGRWFVNEWRSPENLEELLFHFKGALDGIFSALGVSAAVIRSKDPLLHPGYQGKLKVGRTECGMFGALHPAIQGDLKVKQPFLYAELDVDSLCAVARDREFPTPIDLPTIRRDITVKIPEKEFAGKYLKVVSDLNPSHLKDVIVFDNFKKPEESFRRVTYRLTFQSAERTLEHTEIDAAMTGVLQTLKDQHQVELA